MSKQELVEKLLELLRAHFEGHLGFFAQEPYKGDLFHLCQLANENGYLDDDLSPLLTGDSLRALVIARWEIPQHKSVQLNAFLDDVLGCWSEWRYALLKMNSD